MLETGYLILEDGTVFAGKLFGAVSEITGEVVFTTGMTGYLETLTDPSYYGQIVLQTFPLIGNYGVIPADFENSSVGANAYIVKHLCQEPSNFRSEGNLDTFLKEQGVVGLCEIDTRALTRLIRKRGVMNGKIVNHQPSEADLVEVKSYRIQHAVLEVSPAQVLKCEQVAKYRVAVLDFGAKQGIKESLRNHDCEVWSYPAQTSAQEILADNPQGILLSNGPGDPADPANRPMIATIRELMKSGIPIFGICLGHQLLALANGYQTEKLKFGHRGANQPVKELSTGRVYITSQNHGYTVIGGESSFVNVNDGSCEGIDYGNSFSVQFHPEACGGPLDTAFLFEQFVERIEHYATK